MGKLLFAIACLFLSTSFALADESGNVPGVISGGCMKKLKSSELERKRKIAVKRLEKLQRGTPIYDPPPRILDFSSVVNTDRDYQMSHAYRPGQPPLTIKGKVIGYEPSDPCDIAAAKQRLQDIDTAIAALEKD